MEEDYKTWFREIYFLVMDSLANQKKLIKYDILNAKANEQSIGLLESITDEAIKNFYSIRNKWKVEWKTTDEVVFRAEGSIYMLPIEEVFQDVWDDSLGGNDWNPEMKGFRPLDMFYDIDGFVGFYVGRPEKKGLYVQHSDSSVSPLHVDLDGYLRLLGMSKGFGWWQNALVEIHSGNPMPNVASFKEKMPLIFPDFSWDAFVALYEEVRIDK
jgi:hypothetical protein